MKNPIPYIIGFLFAIVVILVGLGTGMITVSSQQPTTTSTAASTESFNRSEATAICQSHGFDDWTSAQLAYDGSGYRFTCGYLQANSIPEYSQTDLSTSTDTLDSGQAQNIRLTLSSATLKFFEQGSPFAPLPAPTST